MMDYLGVVVFIMLCGGGLFLFWQYTHSLSESYIYTFTLSSGTIFLIANVTSAFASFNRRTVLAIYAILLVVLLCLWYFYLKKVLANIYAKLKRSGDCIVILTLVIVFFSISLTLMRALLYPPMNNDSGVYHLPRAIYYYKMNMVDNLPSTYVVMNYSGPANAILLSHWFILSNGHELGVNLIQFPAMICVGAVIYRICRRLQVNFRLSVLGGGLAMSMPLVILQGATTQNDLLAAAYAVCVVYYLIRTKDDHKLTDLFCLGISGGATMLSKIAAGSVFLPFLVAYMIYGGFLLWNKRIKAGVLLRSYLISLVSGISVTVSFWIRNFNDLEGDFLALGPSQYMNGDISYSFFDYIGKVWIYLVYCCCTRYGRISKTVLYYARKIYNAMGATEYGSWDYYLITPAPNHDFYPYGFIFVVSLIALLYLCIRSAREKRVYAILTLISLLLGFLIMPGRSFIQSVTRYVLGNVLLCVPAISVVLNKMIEESSFRWSAVLARGTTSVLLLLMVYNVFTCNYLDTGSPLKKAFSSTYEEKRDLLEPRYMSWLNINSDLKSIIDGSGSTKIGIYEVKLTHIYTFMKEYMADRYEIKSLYGEYASGHRDDNYIPDVIVWVDNMDQPDNVVYGGQAYKKVYSSGQVLDNGAEAFLFVKE